MDLIRAHEDAILLERLLRSGVLTQLICVLSEEDRLKMLIFQHDSLAVLHQIVLIFQQVSFHEDVCRASELRH